MSEETVLEACGDRELPRMGLLEQTWETDPIPSEDVAAVAVEAVGDLDLDAIPAGGTVAVGAGSRGIANIAEIVRGTVEGLADRGYDPFVFPAMGSHGGATAEGQRETLAALGVTEATVGCAIRATMDTEVVGETPENGVPVHADAIAVAADAIVPVNRVKPHTGFEGDVESGLSKMLAIGMGKQPGAKLAHEWAIDWSFREMIPEIAGLLVDALPVAGGVAVVEDQHHDTAIVEGVPPERFLDREAALLATAYDRLPTLPVESLDVLVLDAMGKDVSGTGMDTNVIGRLLPFNEPEPAVPDIKRIYTRSLTPASHGNAAGIGMADFIHQDLLRDVDMEKTVINTVTASGARGARVPPTMETDRAGVVAANATIGVKGPEAVTMIRARSTQHLKRLYASEAIVQAAYDRDDLRVLEEPAVIEFDADGSLAAPGPE